MFGGQHCGGCLEGSIVTDVWRVATLWWMFGGQHCGGCLEGSIVTDVWRAALWRMFGGQHCDGCLEGSIVTDVWRAELWRIFGGQHCDGCLVKFGGLSLGKIVIKSFWRVHENHFGYQLSSEFALKPREKTEILKNGLNCVYIPSPYRAVNSLHLGYKNEPLLLCRK